MRRHLLRPAVNGHGIVKKETALLIMQTFKTAESVIRGSQFLGILPRGAYALPVATMDFQ